jgi:spore germination cell wall hydrolase CwlJ-like protein
MSATATFGRPVGKASDRRLFAWLAAIGLLVSLLTSETLWAFWLDQIGAEDNAYADPDASPAPMVSEREKQLLLSLTNNPVPQNDLTPIEATERNEAIPFAKNSVVGARPFQLFGQRPETGLTALKCLTQAVYHEAAYEPLAGRRAVAQVVLNRMRHPAFPNSVCGVVYQGVNRPVCQFSFTCDGSLRRRINPSAWAEAEMVARDALNGHVEASVGYATHYHANYVFPYWAPKLVKLAKIGAHIFYRWPGGWGLPRSFTDAYAGQEAIPSILPRSLVRRTPDNGMVGEAEQRAYAEARLPANLVPESRTDTDVGGRLDISKGWTAAIPEPEETVRSSSIIARQQAGEFDVSVRGAGQ